jgi:hypothetical protein
VNSVSVPGFSSVWVASIVCLGDPSGNRQRRYFGEEALRELNLSKTCHKHFLN